MSHSPEWDFFLSKFKLIAISHCACIARSHSLCAVSFAHTHFRQDLKEIDVPTLIIHGDDDKRVPIETGSDRTAGMIRNSIYK
ncbi:MAG: alpha/beta fold hydrolase [Flavisolibacter sp.]